MQEVGDQAWIGQIWDRVLAHPLETFTGLLAFVTGWLVLEQRRMIRLANLAKPSVLLEKQSAGYDIIFDNAGNGPAFDIVARLEGQFDDPPSETLTYQLPSLVPHGHHRITAGVPQEWVSKGPTHIRISVNYRSLLGWRKRCYVRDFARSQRGTLDPI
jgi:hypothetical protein